MIEVAVGVFATLTTGAIGWLFKSVIDLKSEVKVLQSQRETYLRELDKLADTMEKIIWEEQ